MTSVFTPSPNSHIHCNTDIHYMTHFPLTSSCDGVDTLLVSTVTLSITVVSNMILGEGKEWQRGIKRGRGQGRGKRSMQEERKGRCEKVE